MKSCSTRLCYLVNLALTGCLASALLSPALILRAEARTLSRQPNPALRNLALRTVAQPFVAQRVVAQRVLAQRVVTPTRQCFQVRQQVGLYTEPNIQGQALGILPIGTQVEGTMFGQGWARVIAPRPGWLTASALQPLGEADCANQSNVIPPNSSQPTAQAPVSTQTVCQVVSNYGLPIREQPRLNYLNVITTLQPGRHTFQFTDRLTRTPTAAGDRQWAYITQPTAGWISLGVTGTGQDVLRGANCPSL
ncbi:MAG: hypothetical protein AAGF24_13180 [Cyanobacteria bacterium P01_H01_bin.121]